MGPFSPSPALLNHVATMFGLWTHGLGVDIEGEGAGGGRSLSSSLTAMFKFMLMVMVVMCDDGVGLM